MNALEPVCVRNQHHRQVFPSPIRWERAGVRTLDAFCMSDVQLLFLVLAIIYGWECASWFARGSSAFRTWFGKRWQLVKPGVLLGNQKGGFIFGNPLPPLGTILAVHEFPLALSPKGFCITQGVDSGLRLRGKRYSLWEKVTHVESKGKKVLLNEELFLKAESPVAAAKIVEILGELKEAKVGDREELIRKRLQKAVDTSRIEARWTEFKNQTPKLRRVTNLLFVHLFVLSPALISIFGFRRSWLVLLLAALALTTTISVLFYRAHKRLFPRLEDERFSHFIIILLSPATAIRARDALTRSLFSFHHPLALTKMFCSHEKFREQAEHLVRQSRFPAGTLRSLEKSTVGEIEGYWRKLQQTILEDFLLRNGLGPEQLIEPPTPTDEACVSYCPRCRSQFTSRDGVCNDCGGLKLQPLATTLLR